MGKLKRFLDVPVVEMLAVCAGSIFTVALAVLGVPAVISASAFWPATALILFAALLALLALRLQWSHQQDTKWKASVESFEKQLYTFGAWFRGRIDWEQTARLSRYPPRLSAQQISSWTAVVGSSGVLHADEQTTLKVARDIYETPYAPQAWEHDFHKARGAMSKIVGQWVEWDAPRFRQFICRTLRVHRNVLVQLAYIEIACADALPSKEDEISEWSRLGDKWPDLFDHPEAVQDLNPSN